VNRLSEADPRYGQSLSQFDIHDVNYLIGRIQHAGHFDVLPFELFGLLLIVQENAFSGLLIREQGILTAVDFHNFAHEGLGLLLVLLCVWILVLGLRKQNGSNLGGAQCQPSTSDAAGKFLKLCSFIVKLHRMM
jgi:hypothetical protein